MRRGSQVSRRELIVRWREEFHTALPGHLLSSYALSFMITSTARVTSHGGSEWGIPCYPQKMGYKPLGQDLV